MEPKLLLSTAKASVSSSLPFFVSYKTSFLRMPKDSVKSHSSASSIQPEKSTFLGKILVLQEKNGFLRNPSKAHVPFGPIKAVVKRRKELPLDNVIQRDKKLKLVLKIRRILVNQPDRVMSLRDLGRYRRDLGLDKKRRFIALLKKFPAIFEIVEEGVFSLKFKLTPEAERLYFEELKVRNEMEDLLVVKLRKLLMMSADKRILLEKIAHLKTDFGLPTEFRDTICHRYPQYFRVVATERGPALELTHWDPELAVSAAELAEEENREKELADKDLIIDRPPKFNIVKLPKGLKLSKGEMRKIALFRDMPFISPYSDFSGLRPGTMEKEKHACAVVHEILSLTVEKRTLVDHLTHFREEFRFSQQLRGMLIRHPDMFYVSLKGDRDSVFLREAYRDSHLIDKDRLLIIKEKLRSLVSVPRFPRRGAPQRDADRTQETDEDEPEDGSGEEGEGWANANDFMSDDGFDDDDEDDDEDDWSDEDDETPPDFDEAGDSISTGVRNSCKESNLKRQDEVLAPVLPDGRPRERW
ncbi:Plant organelle RNA recognition domain containing protein [Parasponia andersonii]|uniref:Plant organelle RNA recognition domain containing protein n=1 Tax=Parasponia andersonii TaxID=3476 RepID=A0A2P5BRA1_PARAD|nr:Plant organelle RNA recognition domain containing protein [Parasponia andersonii]